MIHALLSQRQLGKHLLLVAAFALVACAVLHLPMLAVGYPFDVSDTSNIRYFLETGGIKPHTSSRLLPWLLAPLSHVIPWNDPVGWVSVGMVALALSLLPLWWCAYRLFNARVAWVTVALFAFVPVHWVQAFRYSDYTVGYCFLFLSLAFAIEACGPWFTSALKPVSRPRQLTLIAISGALFGLCMASRDAFMLLLPGICIAAAWHGRQNAKHTAVYLGTFVLATLLLYGLPLLPSVATLDVSLIEKILQLIGAERGAPSFGHFYPDQYTYDFYREEYIQQMASDVAAMSWYDQLQAANYMQIFGASSRTLVSTVLIGTWLLFRSIFPMFTAGDMGGLAMWLVLVPGFFSLKSTNKRLLFTGIWLIFCMEVVTRYVFFAQRSHFMDIAWMFVLVAAVGVVFVAEKVVTKKQQAASIVLISVLLALHLLQINRLELARLYSRSNAPRLIASETVLAKVPPNALVAHPMLHAVDFYMVDRDAMIFAPKTIEKLLAEGTLSDAFVHYGITHAFGYTDALSEQIINATGVMVVKQPAAAQKPRPSRLVEFILHAFR